MSLFNPHLNRTFAVKILREPVQAIHHIPPPSPHLENKELYLLTTLQQRAFQALRVFIHVLWGGGGKECFN